MYISNILKINTNVKGVMNKSLKNISLIGKYSQPMEYIPKEDFPNLIISQTIPRSIQR